jgi:hypothetical protein
MLYWSSVELLLILLLLVLVLLSRLLRSAWVWPRDHFAKFLAFTWGARECCAYVCSVFMCLCVQECVCVYVMSLVPKVLLAELARVYVCVCVCCMLCVFIYLT